MRGAPVATGRFPVIVFSHAAASTPTQSLFLTTHLATHGFIVIAPTHPGSTFEDCLGCGSVERQQALLRESAANRPSEASAALDLLARAGSDPGSPLRGHVDATRAGVIGHSWGGYTAVVSAAGDRRFRAAVAMAPVANAEIERAGEVLRAPVMVMGGELDDITPYPPQLRLFSEISPGVPRFMITFPRGGHTAYSETCPTGTPGCRPGDIGEERAHDLVNAYVTGFLAAYVKGDSRYLAVLSDGTGGRDSEFDGRWPR